MSSEKTPTGVAVPVLTINGIRAVEPPAVISITKSIKPPQAKLLSRLKVNAVRLSPVEPGDRDAMRAAILAYLHEPAEGRVAGAAARRYVVEHHGPAQVDEAVDTLVERLGLG